MRGLDYDSFTYDAEYVAELRNWGYNCPEIRDWKGFGPGLHVNLIDYEILQLVKKHLRFESATFAAAFPRRGWQLT
jgi:hypothetical protein